MNSAPVKESLTRAEGEAIVKTLAAKRIDEKVFRGALASVGAECLEYGCPKFIIDRVGPDGMLKLKSQMNAKEIRLIAIDPAVAKLFRKKRISRKMVDKPSELLGSGGLLLL